MSNNFIEKQINLKEIPKDSPIDLCLLENNEKQISQICDFLQNDKKLLFISGFRGSGKSQVANFVTGELNPNVILLHYTCIETTILDDMLLSFFESFKNYAMLGRITPPKHKTDNFAQKINSYFKTIKSPILIVLDSFDAVVKSGKVPIIDFIKHLSKFDNVKIVVISKSVPSDDFGGLEFEKVTILPLSQKIFEKRLKLAGVKQIGVLSNELYKLSKGYYYNLILSLNLMKLRQLNLVNFLESYSKSYMPFPEFIIREALELVDPVSSHLFRLLTVMRIPIHINLLKSLHMYEEERIRFFLDNSILSADGSCLYLKEYYREIIENQIQENVMIKLHSACVDLYNTQLPLKPLERDLMLSRQTMRNEIEYHSLFLPKKLAANYKTIEVEPAVLQQEELQAAEKLPAEIQKDETKEDKIDKISFIVEDENVLNNIADSIKDFITVSANNSELEKTSVGMSLTQIMNIAKEYERKFNYKQVIMLYQQALTKTKDEDFYTFLPTIYTKLAQAYQNLSDWYEALEYYTQAQDFYVNTSNFEKVAQIKLEIANIYYIMYKHENAKFILGELEKDENLPNELKIKINLANAKLANNFKSEYEYYKKSLPLVEINTDKGVLAELYYKYAVANDENDDLKTAAEYYKKCIELEKNPKTLQYISMSLANIAELFDEAGKKQHAIHYYNESMNIDETVKNYSGLYNSSSHLGEIYSSIDENKAVEYLKKALDCAKLLNEPFYVAGASIEIGDFYFLRHNFEKAYEYYSAALKTAKDSLTEENVNKIHSRINDIQNRLPEQEFKTIREKYDK